MREKDVQQREGGWPADEWGVNKSSREEKGWK